MTKKVGRTVPAVKIGCHAGSFCCLNALPVCRVSKTYKVLTVTQDICKEYSLEGRFFCSEMSSNIDMVLDTSLDTLSQEVPGD